MRHWLMCLSLLAACADVDEVGDPEAELEADGDKGDSVRGLGVDPMSAGACAMLQVVNGHDRAELVALGVPARAAGSIAAYRAAEDGALGTADDRAIVTLEELDGLRDVGATTLRRVRDASAGIQCGGGMVRVRPIRRGAPAAELWGAFRDGDGAWRPLPATDGALVFPVADPAGRYGVAFHCYNEATNWARVAPAIMIYELTAGEARDVVLDRDLGPLSCGSRWFEAGVPVRVTPPDLLASSDEIVVPSLGRDSYYFEGTAARTLKPVAGRNDLLVARRPFRDAKLNTHAIVRRDVDVVPGLRLALDRGEYVELGQVSVPVLAAVDGAYGDVELRAGGAEMDVSGYDRLSPGGARTVLTLPPSVARATDVYVAKTTIFAGGHHLIRRQYAARPEEIVFDAPAFAAPAGTSTRRPDGAMVVTSVPYAGASLYGHEFLGSRGAGWVLVRSGARVAERAVAELPRFAGMRGWNDGWALPATFSSGAFVLAAPGVGLDAVLQPERRAGMTITIVD